MSLQSDVSVNVPRFKASNVPPETTKFNESLQEIMRQGPKWYEVGATKYREMRQKGETPLPPAVHLDSAEPIHIPSRDPGRTIPCRILRPDADKLVTGVFYHIHGGGWVLMDEASQDPYLKRLANECGLLCISVGYRLAPEDPFPAGPNDCYDVAEWLVDNAKSKFGADLCYVGGESAGGNLGALTALHLMSSSKPQYSQFRLKGLVLHFGAFDLSFQPSSFNFNKDPTLVLDLDIMNHYNAAYLPGRSSEERKSPAISPLFADLYKFQLPPALFTCGTEDMLLDDTVFMGVKWQMAGGEAVVKIYPGGPHGFVMFPADKMQCSKEAMDDTLTFIRSKLP